MNFEYIKKSDIPSQKRKYGEVRGIVDKFLEDNQECMVIHCNNKNEATSLYNTIYAFTVRRGEYPIRTTRRGADVYIINKSYKGAE